jgi:hypothetical protein
LFQFPWNAFATSPRRTDSAALQRGSIYLGLFPRNNVTLCGLPRALLRKPQLPLYTLTFNYNSGGNSLSFPNPYSELKVHGDEALVADLVAQQWSTSTLLNLGASSSSTILEFAGVAKSSSG